jgi:DnaJ-class molecular chaperone
MHLSMRARPAAPQSRRLVAAGTIRRHHGRTTRLTATAAGVTGSIRPTAGGCGDCGGLGGHTEDTSGGGVTRQTWRTCQTCRGTGAA